MGKSAKPPPSLAPALSSFDAALDAVVRAIVRDELAKVENTPAALVTIKAYAAARSISQSTVRAAISDGLLEVQRFGRTGRSVRVRATDEIATKGRVTVESLANDIVRRHRLRVGEREVRAARAAARRAETEGKR